MLWVYGHYIYFTLSVRGPTFDRLTFLRQFPRLKQLRIQIPVLKKHTANIADISLLQYLKQVYLYFRAA